jgi:predicted helicase
MATDHRAELRRIRTFPSLVRYLRDEMGWPIDSEDFEALTFEYTPEELGIDARNAAKIEQIKRLRPFAVNQPWGIFFVKFEPKRLPVVALRRILSRVVLKKRVSGTGAERAAWQGDDLLFVSNYGEGEGRRISFAHFSQDARKPDLPTLKVLGWDNLDTALHLDEVADQLTTQLAWPDDEDDDEAWRQRWRAAFTLRNREVITTSKTLALRLAELARVTRDRIKTALAIETETGPLTRLMKAFQEALVHDLDSDGFADMYAQTIAYGLLSARIADPKSKTADDFAAHMRTNPLLRELMETFLKISGRRGKAGGPGIDFDELGISEVVELLDDPNTHMDAVVRDFGDQNPQEDPVIHFYELFLAAYDKKQKVQRGVFYTPRPVVSYIVRSVDELLRTEFGLEDGLADTTTWGEIARHHKDLTIPEGVPPEQNFVQVLDPACGTGTFLVEVIDLIYKTLVAKWKAQGHGEWKIEALWNEYVPKHLLSRLHGYELLMAPYAIAQMKIGLKLYETGYRFSSDERARIYLTNALEPAHDFSGQFEFAIPALAHEAQAVNRVKRHQHFTVIMGNPPYSVSTQNRRPWAISLIGGYKEGLNEKKHTLDDDYVKFAALAQWCINESRCGIWGFITNHGYLKNPTFRGMRRSLLFDFSGLRVYDLHGNLRQKEAKEAAGADENVFDIQQGVVITLAVKTKPIGSQGKAYFAELWGTRAKKYGLLNESSIRSTGWNQLSPCDPFFLFVPQDKALLEEYVRWPSLAEAFVCYGSGIKTDRDELCIDPIRGELRARMKLLFSGKYDSVFVEKYNVRPSSSYNIVELAARTQFSDADLTRCLYRPFDARWFYYKRGFTSRPAYEVMQHMLPGGNIGLLSARTNKSGKMDHFFCTRLPTEVKVAESTTQSCLFPLYLADDLADLHPNNHRALNLSQTFLQVLAQSLALPQVGAALLPQGLKPEDILQYIYAVFHSPGYRSRYAESLKIDFPRLPLTGNLNLFRALTRLGCELVALHLLESPKLDKPLISYAGPENPEIEKVSHARDTVWLDKAQTRGFRGVSEAVWNFHIGGYQVCEKWLKDRKGRSLSREDIDHYHRIVVALSETIRLMQEIDEVIERHGGWPGAFQTAKPPKPADRVIKVAEPRAEYDSMREAKR